MQLSYVAFLDILGFGQIVSSDAQQAVPGSKNLARIQGAISAIPKPNENYQLTQFSDSIVIARPFSKVSADLAQFLEFVRSIQREFFNRGLLMRGGVASGLHHQDASILYSQGLIEAYTLESTRAVGPRVLVSRDLIDLIDPNCEFEFGLVTDEDGELFLHYIREDDLAGALKLLIFALKGKALPDRARQKWVWLSRYLRFAYPEGDFSALPTFYMSH